MKILFASLVNRISGPDSEGEPWHPEDLATAVLVGFLSLVTVIALI